MLSGLALDPVETWALSELTRDRLHDVAADDRLLVVGDDRTIGFTYRNRTHSRERDDEGEGEEAWTEYAVTAWDGASACESLLDTVRRDAASVDADRTRAPFPERIDWVTDIALAQSDLAEEPTFVMEADLS